MIQAVAFDLDGTLVDFLRWKRIASDAAAEAMVRSGLPYPLDRAKGELWSAYETHGLDGNVAFARFISNACGRHDGQMLARAVAAYVHAKERHIAPYPGARRTLATLAAHGIRLALVTDAPREKAIARIRLCGIAHRFEAIVTGDDTPNGKADTRPYALLLHALDLSPHEVLMVGDHPLRDVLGARRAGLRTALAAYGLQPEHATDDPDARPDFTLQSIAQVPQIAGFPSADLATRGPQDLSLPTAA